MLGKLTYDGMRKARLVSLLLRHFKEPKQHGVGQTSLYIERISQEC